MAPARPIWRTIRPELFAVDFLDTTRFECPVIIFQGRHDLTTPMTLVDQWFDDSAHMVLEKEPGKAFLHLVEDVLLLTHAGASAVSPR